MLVVLNLIYYYYYIILNGYVLRHDYTKIDCDSVKRKRVVFDFFYC